MFPSNADVPQLATSSGPITFQRQRQRRRLSTSWSMSVDVMVDVDANLDNETAINRFSID